MAAKTTTPKTDATITIRQIVQDEMHVQMIGTTPLYCHRLPQKARQQLLVGGRKKTAAEKLEIKHHPLEEFRASMDIDESVEGDSVIFFPAMAFKSAMVTAALEIPGIKGTQVKRLIFMPDSTVPIYGIPQLKTDVVRSADMNRTPDIRTRAFFPKWGTEFVLRFTRPALSQNSVTALLHNAGIVAGVGDFRQEKGKGSYGSFRLVEETDKKAFESLRDRQGQLDAIETPRMADNDTAELLQHYQERMNQAT